MADGSEGRYFGNTQEADLRLYSVLLSRSAAIKSAPRSQKEGVSAYISAYIKDILDQKCGDLQSKSQTPRLFLTWRLIQEAR